MRLAKHIKRGRVIHAVRSIDYYRKSFDHLYLICEEYLYTNNDVVLVEKEKVTCKECIKALKKELNIIESRVIEIRCALEGGVK